MPVAAIDWRTRDSLWGSSAAARTVTMDDGGGAQTLEIDERSPREAFDAIATWGAATFGGSWSWTWSDAGVITLTAGVAVSATWGSALQDRLGVPASHSSSTTLAGSSRPPAFVVGTGGEVGSREWLRDGHTGDASGDGAVLPAVLSTSSRTPTIAAVVSPTGHAEIEAELRQATPARVAHVYDTHGAEWTTHALGSVEYEAEPLLTRVVFEVIETV